MQEKGFFAGDQVAALTNTRRRSSARRELLPSNTPRAKLLGVFSGIAQNRRLSCRKCHDSFCAHTSP
jgi:hypothetical protein